MYVLVHAEEQGEVGNERVLLVRNKSDLEEA